MSRQFRGWGLHELRKHLRGVPNRAGSSGAREGRGWEKPTEIQRRHGGRQTKELGERILCRSFMVRDRLEDLRTGSSQGWSTEGKRGRRGRCGQRCRVL